MTEGQRGKGAGRRLYAAWMSFAHALRRVVTAILFGAIYLVVGPIFRVIAGLRRRPDPAATTFWVNRARPTSGIAFFRRLS